MFDFVSLGVLFGARAFGGTMPSSVNGDVPNMRLWPTTTSLVLAVATAAMAFARWKASPLHIRVCGPNSELNSRIEGCKGVWFAVDTGRRVSVLLYRQVLRLAVQP